MNVRYQTLEPMKEKGDITATNLNEQVRLLVDNTAMLINNMSQLVALKL